MIIKNVLLNGEITDITINNGKIEKIGKTSEDGYDANGCAAIPGMVDIHAHGCLGIEANDGRFEEMCEYLGKQGTTSWYPTTITCDLDYTKEILSHNTNCNGAQILGFHMEGPFISHQYKGAQNEKYICGVNLDKFREIPKVKLITLAPELEGAMDFIRQCGAVVCIGHTAADYDTAVEAIKCGASCLTHTFNAMPPLHHRNPSVIGAAVTENIYVQVICDGIHLHKAAVMALYKIFGPERMILISDAISAMGLADGEYSSGGKKITVKDGIARLEDGTIAGSTSTLWKCVKTAVSFGIPFEDAVTMATKTPSTLMGINKGVLAQGYDADILIVDENFDIKDVIIGGKIYK